MHFPLGLFNLLYLPIIRLNFDSLTSTKSGAMATAKFFLVLLAPCLVRSIPTKESFDARLSTAAAQRSIADPIVTPPGAAIRMIGGPGINMNPGATTMEANLCEASAEGLCPEFARFELLVGSPDGSGAQIWAPLCAPEPMPDLAHVLGMLACEQVYSTPERGLQPDVAVIQVYVSEDSYVVPEGPATRRGDFDPSRYTGWVTVTGANATKTEYLTRVQDYEYTVSSEGCGPRGLMAVSCRAWGQQEVGGERTAG
ncbi:hypothetical protein VaNZ11_015825 [Volvox africanus]|uniref:Uncharacterized protein n=1 Tax=Volvox africanus TaxID=51714 RepID=A0ABQ5SNY6_9CHLO|nr:hypothetical protein VaNZ11_015825 [Volvox africanus]